MAFIKAISYYLPDKILSNKDISEKFPEWAIEKTFSKIGISERRIAADGETALDMAVKAGEKLFYEYSIAKEEIDFVLFCTQSPDYFLPTSACIIQHRLGIPINSGAFDFNLGCSGYVYGLAVAKSLIIGGVAKNVLLLTAETYSKYLSVNDKSTRSLFGDAATATVVSAKDGFLAIGDSVLRTDGSGAEKLIVKAGGARNPKCNNPEDSCVYMDGPGIFNFTLSVVPTLIKDLLLKSNLVMDDIQMFVFHQANKFMLEALRKLCRIPNDKFCIEMFDIGNTVSNTIPISLRRGMQKIKSYPMGGIIVTVGFGVGLSWGGNILRVAGREE